MYGSDNITALRIKIISSWMWAPANAWGIFGLTAVICEDSHLATIVTFWLALCTFSHKWRAFVIQWLYSLVRNCFKTIACPHISLNWKIIQVLQTKGVNAIGHHPVINWPRYWPRSWDGWKSFYDNSRGFICAKLAVLNFAVADRAQCDKSIVKSTITNDNTSRRWHLNLTLFQDTVIQLNMSSSNLQGFWTHIKLYLSIKSNKIMESEWSYGQIWSLIRHFKHYAWANWIVHDVILKTQRNQRKR